jgi:serine/threonine-protein kinase
MGANLVLGASVGAAKSGYQLVLRVFDAMNGAVLRKQESRFAFGEVNRLADRASILAAELLDIPQSGAGLKDQDEITKLPPEAYRTFGEAEDSRSQPNDRGLDEAINKYQKVLESEPRFALGFAELSLAYSRQYQIGHDRAFLSLAESNGAMALHYNQQSAKGTLAVAVCYLEAGKTQEAVNGFARALQLDPGNPQILLYKARIYRDLAEMSEEESVYREIIRYRPNYWPGYNELGNCLFHQTRYQEAADAFAEAAALAPRVALPLTNQAVMYFALNRYQDAEGAFRRSLELAPSELAYSNLGTIVFMKGNYQGAIDNYKKALDLNPKSHRAWRNLADSYAMLGDSRREQESYARAAETLADSLRVNPKPGSNWATLAFYHAKLGRRSDAEAELKTADEHGLDSRARFTKAQALAVLGLTEEALALVLDCIDHGLSSLDVDLALDLKQVRADPRYRRHIASSAK